MEADWFSHPDWWFGCSSNVDEYLTLKYQHLLDINDGLSLMDKILIYDQLPRHIFRNMPCNHIISYFLLKVLEVLNEIDIEQLDDARFCFALMPLRHTNRFENINLVISLVWERIKISDNLVLRKFIRACYERCCLVGASEVYLNKSFDKSILYHVPMHKPKFTKSLVNLNLKDENIIISLSGGVDSMVSSWCLVNTYKNVKALHINYNNRKTSDEEERFVRWWCGKLGIKCYVRKFNEIKRESMHEIWLRDVYENYTRNVRYHCYKQFGENAIIVLGHNKDDILENIFTNIANKTKYDNLDGMSEISLVDGIKFYRPLLSMTKREISIYAHENNIPYLPTSTPAWSQRGQIRANIIPSLNKWDPNFVGGLYELSSNVKDMYDIMNDYIQDIIEKALIENNKIEIKINKIQTSLIFWRMLLLGFDIKPSNKSLDNLCTRLKKWNHVEVLKCDIIKNCKMHVYCDKIVIFMNKHLPI